MAGRCVVACLLVWLAALPWAQAQLIATRNASHVIFARQQAAGNTPLLLLPDWRSHLMMFGATGSIEDLIDQRIVLRAGNGVPVPLCTIEPQTEASSCAVPGLTYDHVASGESVMVPVLPNGIAAGSLQVSPQSVSAEITAEADVLDTAQIHFAVYLLGVSAGLAELNPDTVEPPLLRPLWQVTVSAVAGQVVSAQATDLPPLSLCVVVATAIAADSIPIGYAVASFATQPGEATDIGELTVPDNIAFADRIVLFVEPSLPYTSNIVGLQVEVTDVATGQTTQEELLRARGLALSAHFDSQSGLPVVALIQAAQPFTRYNVSAAVIGDGGTLSAKQTAQVVTAASPQPPLVLSWAITNSTIGRFSWAEQRPTGPDRVFSVQVLNQARSLIKTHSCEDPCTGIDASLDSLAEAGAVFATAVVENAAGVSAPSAAVRVVLPQRPGKGSSDRASETVAIVVPVLLVLGLLAVALLYVWRKRNRSAYVPPTPDHFEIERSRIRLGQSIGRGAFGVVYGGTLASNLAAPGSFRVAVAIKVCESTSPSAIQDFLDEIEVMKTVSEPAHTNVLCLLGVCTAELPVMAIVERADLGDLHSYVVELQDELGTVQGSIHGHNKHVLCGILYDIACAMEFLSSMHMFVHRDIAARNILLFDEILPSRPAAKLSDFGMSRLMSQPSVKVTGDLQLPIRWMAPESLAVGTCDRSSDVYAYGVLMFEVFSLGKIPYADLENKQVVVVKRLGATVKPPDLCPPALGHLMLHCMEFEPAERPDWSDVCVALEEQGADTGEEGLLEWGTPAFARRVIRLEPAASSAPKGNNTPNTAQPNAEHGPTILVSEV